MTINTKIKLFLVDDDAVFLKLLAIEFSEHADFEIETFATGELCLANLDKQPDIIVLDYNLDGIEKGAMNGMDTLDAIKASHPSIPVIMLSSQDKIEVAVDCMHHHAIDYVVKSETAFMRLKNIITVVLSKQVLQKQLNWYMERM